VDLPARNKVFVASRCHIPLKAGFGHGRSPIADCLNALASESITVPQLVDAANVP
jgi:hypothetical protein